jgi:hypothetical protein
LHVELGARSGERPHEIAHQDLVAFRSGAEPSRLDDWCAEPVAVLEHRVANADADAHRDLSSIEPAVVPLDGALHGDRARQRVGRTRVRHHQRVADGLHFGAAGRSDGLAQRRKVLAPQLIGHGVADLRRQLG